MEKKEAGTSLAQLMLHEHFVVIIIEIFAISCVVE